VKDYIKEYEYRNYKFSQKMMTLGNHAGHFSIKAIKNGTIMPIYQHYVYKPITSVEDVKEFIDLIVDRPDAWTTKYF